MNASMPVKYAAKNNPTLAIASRAFNNHAGASSRAKNAHSASASNAAYPAAPIAATGTPSKTEYGLAFTKSHSLPGVQMISVLLILEYHRYSDAAKPTNDRIAFAICKFRRLDRNFILTPLADFLHTV